MDMRILSLKKLMHGVETDSALLWKYSDMYEVLRQEYDDNQ